MSDQDENRENRDVSDANLRVISNLYDSVANEAPYEPFFYAMDEVLNQIDDQQDQDSWISVTRTTILGHFAKAAHVFDLLSRKRLETPLIFVEKSPAATCVMDRDGHVIAANRRFEAAIGGDLRSLQVLFATPEDTRRLAALCAANDVTKRAIVHIVLSERSTVPVLIGHAEQVELQDREQTALFASLIQPVWREETGELLSDTFDLKPAEIDILQQFVETGSIQKVAEIRQRSIRTVRTQVSSIFAKMGIQGQTDLAFFLATLGDLSEGSAPDCNGPDPQSRARDADIRSLVLTLNGAVTEVLDYGPADGAPVFLIQSTHPPELTRTLRRHLFEAGLRVIAPIKPGSGCSEFIAKRPDPEQMAQMYARLLDKLSVEQAVIAGQSSGGLYALEFAKQYPDKCISVVLIDTGVPFRSRAEIMKLPAGLRRTMIPARFLPDLLYLPHKIVASNFRRSREGEASVVNYFFADSPAERELTRTKREYYNVTRNIISYSFDDTDRLVEDVVRWASNWEPLLRSVSSAQKIHFFHGQDNTFFTVSRIEDWIAKRGNCELTTAPSAGQLAAFAHPELLTQVLLSAQTKANHDGEPG